jgi:hypothetical protein
MYKMNGITLNVTRTYNYEGDLHNIPQGTPMYELRSACGRYSLRIAGHSDVVTLADLDFADAA